jgi:hypothetical protein
LLTQAFGRLAQLPPDVQEDVKALVGIPIAQKDLLAYPTAETLNDVFVILAQKTTTEDDLISQRTYLYGTQSGRYALILNFAHRTAPALPFIGLPGAVITARLVFYPGTAPYRAVLLDGTNPKSEIPNPKSEEYFLPNWSAAQQALTDTLTQSPFAAQVPQTIANLRTVAVGENLYLKDNQGLYWPIDGTWPRSAYWQLLALTAGQPVPITVLRHETTVQPLGAWLPTGYQSL